ncbi:hypothetical protein PTTG_27756 [Puccinia triticina 1-1 BBBD Race 1]|uniref:Uncharacterized protein n=1 Tax=Puccinia triticina (isolate 1-1 / race 1 (BBBD)) TaxID=630390 RepID=A0A180GI27_PUCT1|nr:hypothetical protein PTTG_27756 [Puccinia triticina 1-1 BBBD Race 1]
MLRRIKCKLLAQGGGGAKRRTIWLAPSRIKVEQLGKILEEYSMPHKPGDGEDQLLALYKPLRLKHSKTATPSILSKDVIGMGGTLDTGDGDERKESPCCKWQCKDPSLLGKQGRATAAAVDCDCQTQQFGTALLPLAVRDLLATLNAHAGSIKIPAAGPLGEQQAIEVAPGDSAQPRPELVPIYLTYVGKGIMEPAIQTETSFARGDWVVKILLGKNKKALLNKVLKGVDFL